MSLQILECHFFQTAKFEIFNQQMTYQYLKSSSPAIRFCKKLQKLATLSSTKSRERLVRRSSRRRQNTGFAKGIGWQTLDLLKP